MIDAYGLLQWVSRGIEFVIRCQMCVSECEHCDVQITNKLQQQQQLICNMYNKIQFKHNVQHQCKDPEKICFLIKCNVKLFQMCLFTFIFRRYCVVQMLKYNSQQKYIHKIKIEIRLHDNSSNFDFFCIKNKFLFCSLFLSSSKKNFFPETGFSSGDKSFITMIWVFFSSSKRSIIFKKVGTYFYLSNVPKNFKLAPDISET